MKILGIDPGLATGTAVYDLETRSFVRMDELQGGIAGFKEPFLALNTPLVGVTHIAAEKFTLRASNKFVAGLQGVEILGWLYGEEHIVRSQCPEPIQHMTLTRLREKKDKYQDSVITHMMKEAGFKIGKGHTRMAGSVAVWYAAKVLKHKPTLELLSRREK